MFEYLNLFSKYNLSNLINYISSYLFVNQTYAHLKIPVKSLKKTFKIIFASKLNKQ